MTTMTAMIIAIGTRAAGISMAVAVDRRLAAAVGSMAMAAGHHLKAGAVGSTAKAAGEIRRGRGPRMSRKADTRRVPMRQRRPRRAITPTSFRARGSAAIRTSISGQSG